jgi:OOP family OmpA-OmpF porin
VADSDGDGVADDRDKCPGTPPGMKVDADGCHDSDGDGVANVDDKCPGTPRGTKVDRDGCELLAPVTLEGVHFDYNKSSLTSAAKATLDANVAKIMRNGDRIKAIHVVGHTDSHGPKAYNQMLSEKRAKSVAAYLKAKGVSVKVMAKGMGETMPVADNGTREGRAKNRRVEISFK